MGELPKATSARKPATGLLIILLVFTALRCSQALSEVRYRIDEELPRNFVVGNIVKDSNLRTELDASTINSLQYTLISRGSLPTDYFKINNKTSELTIAKPIDRDSLCDLLSICCDTTCVIPISVAVQPTRGDFFLKTVVVKVQLQDKNDNAPKFDEAKIDGHVSEFAAVGTTVTIPSNGNLLLATDRDAGDNNIENYTIISPTNSFGLRIEQTFGTITDVAIVTMKALDREEVAQYEVYIVAVDGGDPSRSGTVTVSITIDDSNDNSPRYVGGIF